MAAHDISVRRIAQVGAGVVLCVAASVVTAFVLLAHWRIPVGEDRAMPPIQWPADAPGLQPAPQPDLAGYRAGKQKLAESFGWVDRAGGIARIPVSAAMELLARRAASAAAPAASAASGAAR
jgi:hypothetical protein